MRLLVLGWSDADWDDNTEDRMVKLVQCVITERLEEIRTVPPDIVELLPTFTATDIPVALGITTEDDD